MDGLTNRLRADLFRCDQWAASMGGYTTGRTLSAQRSRMAARLSEPYRSSVGGEGRIFITSLRSCGLIGLILRHSKPAIVSATVRPSMNARPRKVWNQPYDSSPIACKAFSSPPQSRSNSAGTSSVSNTKPSVRQIGFGGHTAGVVPSRGPLFGVGVSVGDREPGCYRLLRGSSKLVSTLLVATNIDQETPDYPSGTAGTLGTLSVSECPPF